MWMRSARLSILALAGTLTATSAADLKFLHRLRQTHFRNFKSAALVHVARLDNSRGAVLCARTKSKNASGRNV